MNSDPETYPERIDLLLRDFDFEKVHRVMAFLEWQWMFDGGRWGIPNVSELRDAARERLRDVTEKGAGISMSGGFVARRDVHEEGEYLSLAFTLESTEETE